MHTWRRGSISRLCLLFVNVKVMLLFCLFSAQLTTYALASSSSSSAGRSTIHHMNRKLTPLLEKRQKGSGTPLVISNQCGDTIYPGVVTQSGNGPATGGFQLTAGSSRTLTVSENWQGRVWGRTNCSFNSDGTGPGSISGNGVACQTGDCGGIINCRGTGQTPVSLAEFTLDTGSGQTFYDISLVDGYNIPMAIVLQPLSNSSFSAIPPNLTNPSCVATAGNLAPQGFSPYGSGTFLGTNSSSPLPFDQKVTASDVASWCPSNLEVSRSTGPASGIYTYPDGNLQRPAFDPCYSACAKYNKPSDCCTGGYDSPSSCQPSQYSAAAKKVCPDAYSYAFDDQTSTFIIPSGAGFEVVFCPGGRSTNILGTSKTQLTQLAQQGHVGHFVDKFNSHAFDLMALVARPMQGPDKRSEFPWSEDLIEEDIEDQIPESDFDWLGGLTKFDPFALGETNDLTEATPSTPASSEIDDGGSKTSKLIALSVPVAANRTFSGRPQLKNDGRVDHAIARAGPKSVSGDGEGNLEIEHDMSSGQAHSLEPNLTGAALGLILIVVFLCA